MRNVGLEEAQARLKIVGRNINNLRYADDTNLMAESEEELKSILMKVKEESERVVLKLNIQKTKIMASGPITSWKSMGRQWKQYQTLVFWAPKSLQMVIATMKLKDTPWKESYDQTKQHIQKQRHYFANKGPSGQTMVFPVVMYGCESWTIKKTWVPKNWCFWTVVLEKTLESPLDCKEIQPVHPKGD